MSERLLLLLVIPALFISACSFMVKQTERGGKEKPGIIQVRPSDSSSPAVLSLLQKARTAAKAGQLEVAEGQLERALRIEPRNASLWHYLAKLRLNQGRLAQAIGLAAKSNSLEHADRILQADNWRIIAHARYQQGNIKAARAAQARVGALTAETP
ncbi:hypothetical protein MNBD_GAMMA24-1030 [hydrothermal vent metagenome]|uniref:Uncharacterized protein n=1 Tax=hydrothermal vent metagenome TaxID=652676 RepID=A0A3B1B2L6_9ZZZZ